jgi:hypothetical protein
MKGIPNFKLQSSLLLFGEVVLLVTSALWDNFDGGERWPAWLYIILFSAGGYALANSHRWLFTYLGLVLIALCIEVFATKAPILIPFGILSFSGAYFLLFWAIAQHSLFRKGVHRVDRLLSGIAGYLLLGFFWSTQTNWATLLHEDAFRYLATGKPVSDSEQLYFSFVTLTTLGYGEIIPTTPEARVITLFCSLSGVLYLAVFVSALVGGLRKQD